MKRNGIRFGALRGRGLGPLRGSLQRGEGGGAGRGGEERDEVAAVATVGEGGGSSERCGVGVCCLRKA